MLITNWIWALASVLVVSAATAGYGCFLAHYFRSLPRVLALVLGLGLVTNLSLLTGLAGGYNAIVQSLILLVGLVLLALHFRALPRAPRVTGRDRWWLVWPGVYFLTRFFSCGIPQQHGDALYYHLAAPRLWTELGQIRLTMEHPSYAQAALWETLYGIPQMWFGTSGMSELVTSHLYGQWMHMLWGQVACVLVGAVLLTRLQPKLEKFPGLSVFLAWLATTQPVFEWLGCLAKNDYVLMLFVLSAALAATRGFAVVAGLFVGLAFSVKFLALWGVVGVALLLPWRRWPVYGGAALVAALPVLLRNFIWTSNPVFPNLDDVIGAHWISSWWINHNKGMGGSFAIRPEMTEWAWNQLFHRALPKIMLGAGLVALVVDYVRTKRLFEPRWLMALGAQLLLIVLMLTPHSDGRYGNYIAALCALYAAALVTTVAVRSRVVMKWGWVALLPLGLLINVPVDAVAKIPKHYLFAPSEKYLEQFHFLYRMHAWIRENVSPEDRILFTVEKQQYYLDRPFETVVEMKKWEEILTPIKSPAELFETARKLGFRYIHISPDTGGYPGPFRPYWDELLSLRERAVYRSPTALIFDLKSH